jgi:uncharacterized protein (DUF305 family)
MRSAASSFRSILTRRLAEPDTMRPELADMPGMMAMNMAWLQAKRGNDFDVAFLTAMSDHHAGGIKMARMFTGAKHRAGVRQMARSIIAAQSPERAKMLAWKQRWSAGQ